MALRLDNNDEWYESEESTRATMVAELQRIKRRTLVRPVPVLLLAALLTTAITYKVATKKRIVEAEIVLALSEGTLSSDRRDIGIPVDHLRDYIGADLMPRSKLEGIVERRDLFRLRKKLGMDFAIDELRSNMEIAIWHNSFLVDDDQGNRSARIGITYGDTDPDLALEVARDLAQTVVQSAAERRQDQAAGMARQLAAMHEDLARQLGDVRREQAKKQVEHDRAVAKGQKAIAEALDLEGDALERQAKALDLEIESVVKSADVGIAANGLDVSLNIVEEHRPERPESHGFVMILIGVVIGIGSLIGSALLVGAFDSRVHDTDDVERLGLPILGHVPGFPGDGVGSLAARGALRRRVPSFLRWRSPR
ncbi:MAG: hypothetical protein JO257_31360 [Deltaproteobacteria bacterium]|nr:hypothetical protein [Deltaproteobacteria bacterium]